LASENNVVAKLAGVKERFMAEFQGHAARFRMNVQESREKFLNEIIELTMTDPNIAAVQKALDFFKPSKEAVVVVPASGPATLVAAPVEVESAVAVTLAPPEKEGLKARKRPAVPSSCPNCRTPILEASANFCSRCAYPLIEA
jgi:hypothetical protein